MGPAFVAVGWMIVIGCAFVPAFIAAMVMLRSVWRAFVLAATFTAGAFAGFVGGGFLGAWLMESRSVNLDTRSTTLLICFATAGAIGGGALAVYLLGRYARFPPWRRY
jgi:hypothetical protein